MKLKYVNQDTQTNVDQCLVEFSPLENTSSIFVVNLSDEELTLINPNWWLAEIKQVLSTKLNTTVEQEIYAKLFINSNGRKKGNGLN